MPLKNRLKAARNSRGWTQKRLGEAIGVSPQAVSQWERGETEPEADRIREVARATRSDFYWLLDGDVEPGPEPQPRREEPKIWRAPIVNRVAAGTWTESVTSDDLPADTRYLDVYSKPAGRLFALEVTGESMEPTFSAGDIIIVDTGVAPLPGDFVVAKLDEENEATFKKFRPRGKRGDGSALIELQPLNSDFPTLSLSADRPGRIVGTMVEHRRFRRRR